jgi:hypothetical protein
VGDHDQSDGSVGWVVYASYQNYNNAFAQIGHWLEVVYMTERILSSLAYLTPAEFEAAAITANQSSFAFCVLVSD